MSDAPRRWEDVVGANVRTAREAQDMLQEELAREVRLAGPKWSYTTVVRLEGGKREPSMRELVALATALQVPLSELLAGGEGTVELRPGMAADLAKLRENIADNLPPIPRASLDIQHGVDKWSLSFEAESHAAKRLNCSVEELRSAATALWGHPYYIERDARLQGLRDGAPADPESRRSQRGHVSRRLLAELRRYFDREATR